MNPIKRKSARVALLSSLALTAAFAAQAKGPNAPAPADEAASSQAKPASGGTTADTRELRDSSVQGSAPADLRKGVAPADLRKSAPATEVRDSRTP